MKYKNTILSTSFIFLGLVGLRAQESLNGSGGEGAGTGGSSSYSIGQVVYTTETGANGSVSQGVQQAYEISIITGINETAINLQLSANPNPTTNYIVLAVEYEQADLFTYQLIDLQGKVIENKKITAKSTTITMEALPKAVYFLNVANNKQVVKSFKVIKN
jgi:hypothetical protein